MKLTSSKSFYRDRLDELRCRVSTPVLHQTGGGSVLFSSSENEADDDDEDLDFVDAAKQQQQQRRNGGNERHVANDISRRKKMPTPTPSLEDSVYSSLSNEMYSKIGSPSSNPSPKHRPVRSPISPDERRRASREALRAKLKECALVSESGSASVIEVIEPTSSEEEEFERSLRQLNLGWNLEPKTSSRSSRKTSEVNSSGRSSQIGKDFEQLEEHFVDESSFDDADGRQIRRSKKKSNFLQKIGLKATKWQIRKSPTPTRRTVENVDKNDLGCSPLVYANLQSGEIEEHVLPDSFDDENFFESAVAANQQNGKDGSNVETKVDISAIRRKFENGDGGNDVNGGTDVTIRCSSSSLSPSSRKSMLNPGSSYRSSTTSAVSANSASANSVAASEDSGIVVTQPRPVSSASIKPNKVEISLSSPNTIFNNNNNNNSSEVKLKSVTTSDYVIKPHLGKIEESPVAATSSRCSSSSNGINASESVRNKSRPGAAIRRRDSSQKAWYDVPSDEDHDAPEADSLASIISNRSSSEEDF